MVSIVSGLLNKQVAGNLGISEITVKAHRGQVMRKMRARSFATLVKQADRLGLDSEPAQINFAALRGTSQPNAAVTPP
jgi:DNA-binding NarL/FixJ family response regulator